MVNFDYVQTKRGQLTQILRQAWENCQLKDITPEKWGMQITNGHCICDSNNKILHDRLYVHSISFYQETLILSLNLNYKKSDEFQEYAKCVISPSALWVLTLS